MEKLAHLTNRELGEDFAWINMRISNLTHDGRGGLADIPESLWTAHDELETELLSRGVLTLN